MGFGIARVVGCVGDGHIDLRPHFTLFSHSLFGLDFDASAASDEFERNDAAVGWTFADGGMINYASPPSEPGSSGGIPPPVASTVRMLAAVPATFPAVSPPISSAIDRTTFPTTRAATSRITVSIIASPFRLLDCALAFMADRMAVVAVGPVSVNIAFSKEQIAKPLLTSKCASWRMLSGL
jgi:hypothetical protein